MGTAERTGGTICSFSSRTWGLWMTGGKKKTPNIQNPSLRAIMWRIPSLFNSSCAPLLLSSSLLFFFNQAVWGCQVFWDEDSQPCEKLIPCGPSSLWRSSPWEHWWWLEAGGGLWREEGWMEGWRVHEQKATWPADWVEQTLILTLRPTPELIFLLHPFLPGLSNATYTHQFFPALLSTIHPLSVNPQVQDLLMRFPSGPSDGWDEERRGFAMWRARGVASGGWQWFTREKVLLLHYVPNLPGRGTDPPLPHPNSSYPPPPQPLGFNRSSLVVPLCVKATIPTGSSWAPCQGMKDMIDNNGGKTRRSTELSGNSIGGRNMNS